MTKLTRRYKTGDEVHINHLYKSITGIVRTKAEYFWEWVETWNGPGSIWLIFDDTREPDDQLIGQYSLIPIPFSFWGKKSLAGKTENCMSHLDFRGKGMYFFHERDSFEEAKDQFDLFFTTTGDVAKGAPGKVRMKLGYRPFDHWVTFSFWLSLDGLGIELTSKLPRFIQNMSWLKKLAVRSILWVLSVITKSRKVNPFGELKFYSENDAPLNEIEVLWKQNVEHYGITVDRTNEYLQWRINNNPYLEHSYLCYYEENILKGYLIYSVQNNVVYIVDILAASKDKQVFSILLDSLKDIGYSHSYSQIKCYTASKNDLLIGMLRRARFINFSELFNFSTAAKIRPTQIFVYLSEQLGDNPDLWENKHWYITDLIKEGRSI